MYVSFDHTQSHSFSFCTSTCIDEGLNGIIGAEILRVGAGSGMSIKVEFVRLVPCNPYVSTSDGGQYMIGVGEKGPKIKKTALSIMVFLNEHTLFNVGNQGTGVVFITHESYSATDNH